MGRTCSYLTVLFFRVRGVETLGSDITALVNPLTPNDLERRRAVSPLKIKIPSKNICEKPTNTPIIHSVY
jgi:hypothetical protein